MNFNLHRSNPSKNKGRCELNTATGSANGTGNKTMYKSSRCSRDWTCWQKWILDPGSNTMLIWNRTFLISCVASQCVDPLFFFLLTVESAYPCMKIEQHFAIMLTYLRTLIDMFFLVHIATRFFTAYIDPASIVLGKGELVTDPEKIAYRYIRTNFCIDLAAALPVPQVCVLCKRTAQPKLEEWFMCNYWVLMHLPHMCRSLCGQSCHL